MYCEQAIFTSLRSRRQEGYQLAATSPGVTAEIAKELAQWGPAHDSLLVNEQGQSSLNFHTLEAGAFCISRTVADGPEYSGRAGPRIYTQLLIVPPALLEKFSFQPLAVLEAVTASGQAETFEQPPGELPQVRLLGRASLIHALRLAELTTDPGVESLVRLVHLAVTHDRLLVRSNVPLERLFAGMLMLMPLSWRPRFSFSTGLRHSARRPLRWLALPPEASEQRSMQRSSGAVAIDLTRDKLPPLSQPESAWAQLVREVLASGHLNILPELLERAEHYRQAPTLDDVAREVEHELRAEAHS